MKKKVSPGTLASAALLRLGTVATQTVAAGALTVATAVRRTTAEVGTTPPFTRHVVREAHLYCTALLKTRWIYADVLTNVCLVAGL